MEELVCLHRTEVNNYREDPRQMGHHRKVKNGDSRGVEYLSTELDPDSFR